MCASPRPWRSPPRSSPVGGIALEKRPAGEKVESLSTDSLGLNLYESERPSEEEACRTGDVRFFPQGGR